jgi:hypothetical protein
MKKDENARLMNREPEQTIEELMIAIAGSQCDLPSSNDGEDGKHEAE